jgi:hypothetical protein
MLSNISSNVTSLIADAASNSSSSVSLTNDLTNALTGGESRAKGTLPVTDKAPELDQQTINQGLLSLGESLLPGQITSSLV